MQEIESRAEDLVLDIEQKLGTRDAEAQSRQAPIWASISGQYLSLKLQEISIMRNSGHQEEEKYRALGRF